MFPEIGLAKKGEIQILKVDASGYGLFESGERGGGGIDDMELGMGGMVEGVDDLIDGPCLIVVADIVLDRECPERVLGESAAERQKKDDGPPSFPMPSGPHRVRRASN